jgi:hypothetical protein
MIKKRRREFEVGESLGLDKSERETGREIPRVETWMESKSRDGMRD